MLMLNGTAESRCACGWEVEYYSAIKENEIMPFAATGMDLEILELNEVSQTEEKHRLMSLTCRI